MIQIMASTTLGTLGIGYDASFSLNEFGQPKILSELEVIKNAVLFILFAKPGQYPSIPNLGLNIRSMLYSYYDEIVETELETKIADQCSALGVFFSSNVICVRKTKYRGQPSLLIHIAGKANYPDGYMRNTNIKTNAYLIGITFDEFNKMVYNINSMEEVA